jgi:hypothetical protein
MATVSPENDDLVEVGGTVGRIRGHHFYPVSLEDGRLIESPTGFGLGDAGRSQARRISHSEAVGMASSHRYSEQNSLLDNGD